MPILYRAALTLSMHLREAGAPIMRFIMNGFGDITLTAPEALASALLLTGLMILSVIDWRTFRLPNVWTFPLILAGLIYSYFFGDMMMSALGVVIGYLAFVTLEVGYKKIRGRDGLGRGDAKLLAAGGAWCGVLALPFIVLIASGSALAALILPSMRRHADRGHLPFGPFISFGIFLCWLAIKMSGA